MMKNKYFLNNIQESYEKGFLSKEKVKKMKKEVKKYSQQVGEESPKKFFNLSKEKLFKATFMTVCLVAAIKSPITAAPLQWNNMATSEITEIVTGVPVPPAVIANPITATSNIMQIIEKIKEEQQSVSSSVKNLEKKQKEMDVALQKLEENAINAIAGSKSDNAADIKKTLQKLQEEISNLKNKNSKSLNSDNVNASVANIGKAQHEQMQVGVMTTDSLFYDYTISGDVVNWKPTVAFDNGKVTYLKMNSKYQREEPTLLVWENDDWVQSYYELDLKTGLLIVNGVYDKIQLKMDNKTVKINK